MALSQNMALPVSLRFAIRELRGGLKGFRVFMACLILGVAAIAAVGSLTASIELGLKSEGQAILGADIEVLKSRNDITSEQKDWLANQGTMSVSSRLRTMARNFSGESTLVELRAVDNLYPLYGHFQTIPSLGNAALFDQRDGKWGTAIEAALASRLNVKPGDILKVGGIDVEVRATIGKEPDKANLGFQLGPSMMINLKAMSETGLVTSGSLIEYNYKIKNPNIKDVKAWRKAANDRYPGETWRLRDSSGAAPGMQRFVNRMSMFLTLVGLTALVVGGVGVGNAVKGYMDRKNKTIATFKILGAQGGDIFAIYFMQVILLGIVSIAIGLAFGALMPGLLVEFLPDNFPVNLETGLYPRALMIAGLYGILVTISFTVWPLGKARDIPPVRLFRSVISPEKGVPRTIYTTTVFLSAVIVIFLAISLADNMRLASGFIGGAILSLLILRGTGSIVEAMTRLAPRPKNALFRLALSNIHRPGSATGAVVVSLGLGLTLFVTLALIEGNLDQELNNQVPAKAPAFFFVDIQKAEIDDFKKTALSIDGVDGFEEVASLRARVTGLKGIPVEEAVIAPNSRWVVRGDRSVSYSAEAPKRSPIVKGDWWPKGYSGSPEVSLGSEIARDLGLDIGDTITLEVLGRSIKARLRSTREITWGNMGFNFAVMFDPNTLAAAPHSYMASLRATNESEQKAYNSLTQAFPSVTAIRVKEIIGKISDMLLQIGLAIRVTSLVAIVAGVFVLAGAIAAGFEQRVYDAVILKVIGAVRSQILKAYISEYLLLGLITAFIALLLGGLAGYLVVDRLMEMEFVLLPTVMIMTVLASLFVTIIFGLLSSIKALSIRPNQVLRGE